MRTVHMNNIIVLGLYIILCASTGGSAASVGDMLSVVRKASLWLLHSLCFSETIGLWASSNPITEL